MTNVNFNNFMETLNKLYYYYYYYYDYYYLNFLFTFA